MVLCVVMLSLQSNCFVTVHVVSPCCPGYCKACQCLCLLSLLLLVTFFCESGHGLGLYCLLFFLTNVIVGDASVDLISNCLCKWSQYVNLVLLVLLSSLSLCCCHCRLCINICW